MDTRGKLLKVTFEYENQIETLEGTQVVDWNNDLTSVCTLAHVHGQNPDWGNYQWDKRRKNETKNN